MDRQWEAKKIDDPFNHYVVSDSDGRIVCALVGGEVNARLIAAAPEMLAALEAIFRECALVHKYWGDGSNTREADAAIAAATGAIVKAGGTVPCGR
jgi:hypothetical protein